MNSAGVSALSGWPATSGTLDPPSTGRPGSPGSGEVSRLPCDGIVYGAPSGEVNVIRCSLPQR